MPGILPQTGGCTQRMTCLIVTPLWPSRALPETFFGGRLVGQRGLDAGWRLRTC